MTDGDAGEQDQEQIEERPEHEPGRGRVVHAAGREQAGRQVQGGGKPLKVLIPAHGRGRSQRAFQA
jgi:hypothetical protein